LLAARHGTAMQAAGSTLTYFRCTKVFNICCKGNVRASARCLISVDKSVVTGSQLEANGQLTDKQQRRQKSVHHARLATGTQFNYS
jgi:hypothetical protein